MRHVILPIGPQFAGKSTFCKAVSLAHPQVEYVSRDEILMEMFGDVYLSPYEGGHLAALDKMWRITHKLLEVDDVTLILDTWNGLTGDRLQIVTKLRSCFGVDRIDAWYFVTPEEVCFEWSLRKRPIGLGNIGILSFIQRESRKAKHSHSYRFFHSQPIGEGLFDSVVEIDPCQQYLFPLSEVFYFQGQP